MIQIAERMKNSKPSMIRELMKEAMKPGNISLAAGNPSVETFPIEALSRISQEIYREMAPVAFSYGTTEGYQPLRDRLKERYQEKYQLFQEYDQLQIFTGGQQAIDLVARAFVNEGDVVLCEERSYPGAICAFRSFLADIKGVAMDGDGMIPEALEDMLKRYPNTKVIYTIPTYQNPAGVAMSVERRERIYELAVQYDVLLLEDSPYFELSYNGKVFPPIKTFDRTGHVIFLGSMSKILTPGIRVGFAICEKSLMRAMTIGKQVADMHTPIYSQMLAERYLAEEDMDDHIQECRALYKKKRDVMVEAMEEHFGGRIQYRVPEGGLFIWCTLPEGVSGMKFCEYLLKERHVVCVPGCGYTIHEEDVNAMRLNFSVPSLEEIRTAIARIGESISSFGR